jgi:TolA-binding protein
MKIFTPLLSTAMVLAVIFAAPLAEARKAKPTGDSGVEEELKLKAGDETGNEIKSLKTEMLVIRSEKRALVELQKLEKKHRGTRMEPEILFRLGELYMRRARSERFFEVHRNSEKVVMFAPTQVSEASEANEIRKGISLYEQIQQKFPRFRAIDLVIFNDADAHQQIGDTKSAESLLTRLVKDPSGSLLVPDAYLGIGEICFGRRAFKEALENFRAIRRYPQARVYPYGLYKAAWAYYNLQDAESGLKQLEEVVSFGREMALSKADSKLDLRKEALNDMSLFFGDVRDAKSAVAYFKDQAKELDAIPYIMRLVELYNRHSRYNDIEAVLKDVLAVYPDTPSASAAHEELAWNYERLKNRGKAGDQLTSFDKWCDARVVEAPKAGKGVAVRPECRDKLANATKKLSAKWHALWKKQGGPDELSASAESMYRLFLKNASPADPELAAVHFSFAELLFARARFREASDNYAMIEGYNKALKIDAKVSHDAAYGAIVALEKANNDKYNEVDEKRFVELSESYIRRFPKGQYVLDLQFKRAYIAYEKERYDEAAPQFKKIGWTYSGDASEKVRKSQDLYLDILNLKKDFKGIKEAARSLMGKSADATRTTHIEKLYREAYFSEIQQTEEKGDLLGAVDAYKKFALENTTSELAAKAWWNASQLQFKIGDAQGGANTCYQMHKLFPTSTNGKDCLTKAAQTFEAMGRLDLAARVLLNLALVEKENANKWREVAADFFALSDSKDRAIQMYLKLAEEKKGEAQVKLFEKAEAVARESGDAKTIAQAEAYYLKNGVEPQASRLLVMQAEQAFEKKDYNSAFNLSKKLVSRDSLPKNILARARFLQARVLEEEYRTQSVKARADRIGMVLALKTEKLEKAQKAYQAAIHYGDPETSVKSLQRLAGCYLDYSTTLKEMQLNGGVSEADQAAFKAEVDQLAVPMEEKGIESMTQALEAAKKAKLREGQVADLQSEVDRLNMKVETALPKFETRMPAVYVPHLKASL